MSDAIPPELAARLADGVYGIVDGDSNSLGEAFASRGVSGIKEHFDLAGDKSTIATGKTGVGPISKTTNFALVLQGKGQYQNQLAVVARGTNILVDWLSNFDVGLDRGPAGLPVHHGFSQVFKSIDRAVMEGVAKSNKPTHIHCVGHSLGGAVANLLAIRFADAGNKVSLYTFGAPRVGWRSTMQYIEAKIKTENIYRVYNPSDIVPMVPIHPFAHAPYERDGFSVTTAGALFSINAHLMSSYSPAVANHSWGSLAGSTSSVPLHASVDQWMDTASNYVKIPGSSMGLWALGHALKGLIDLASATVGIGYVAVTTVPDLLAQLLLKAASLSLALGAKIVRWIELVLKFAGRTAVNVGQNITQTFLRWVLELMVRPMLSLARRAIEYSLG